VTSALDNETQLEDESKLEDSPNLAECKYEEDPEEADDDEAEQQENRYHQHQLDLQFKKRLGKENEIEIQRANEIAKQIASLACAQKLSVAQQEAHQRIAQEVCT
jgi:hypothetical protein